MKFKYILTLEVLFYLCQLATEAVEKRCSVKKVFLKILQNSQKRNCARVFILKKFQASACKFIAKRRL